MDYEDVSFVVGSKIRLSILTRLSDRMYTPTGLASSMDIDQSHVSRALKEMLKRGIVTQVTRSRKGRLYSISDKGKKVLEETKSIH
jgi:DNA-binding MarR family transcriptional regulator